MSNGSSGTLALGLGVAGGAAIWYFTRDKKKKASEAMPSATGASSVTSSSPGAAPTIAGAIQPSIGAPPPRVPGPCSLKLDKSGLTVDGERTDISTAVERCKTAGKVEWALMPDAPSAVVVELSKALAAAKLPVVMKK
jgi:hypothetical protein